MLTDSPVDRAMMLLKELNILEPKEIAEDMRLLGIKGVPFDTECCPIANYLRIAAGAHFAVWANEYIAYDDEGDAIGSGTMPSSVKKFIKQFDAGRFLFLDDNRI